MANEKLLIDANVLKVLFDVRYDTAFIQERTRENKEQWNGYCTGINWGRNTIADAPTVDAVEVVRCKDCKKWDKKIGYCEEFTTHRFPAGGRITFLTRENDFCSYGERKDT